METTRARRIRKWAQQAITGKGKGMKTLIAYRPPTGDRIALCDGSALITVATWDEPFTSDVPCPNPGEEFRWRTGAVAQFDRYDYTQSVVKPLLECHAAIQAAPVSPRPFLQEVGAVTARLFVSSVDGLTVAIDRTYTDLLSPSADDLDRDYTCSALGPSQPVIVRERHNGKQSDLAAILMPLYRGWEHQQGEPLTPLAYRDLVPPICSGDPCKDHTWSVPVPAPEPDDQPSSAQVKAELGIDLPWRLVSVFQGSVLLQQYGFPRAGYDRATTYARTLRERLVVPLDGTPLAVLETWSPLLPTVAVELPA